jgi:hypothetical protein
VFPVSGDGRPPGRSSEAELTLVDCGRGMARIAVLLQTLACPAGRRLLIQPASVCAAFALRREIQWHFTAGHRTKSFQVCPTNLVAQSISHISRLAQRAFHRCNLQADDSLEWAATWLAQGRPLGWPAATLGRTRRLRAMSPPRTDGKLKDWNRSCRWFARSRRLRRAHRPRAQAQGLRHDQ